MLLIDADYLIKGWDQDYQDWKLDRDKAQAIKDTFPDELIVVLSNTRGEHYNHLRSLLSDYPFQTYTLENIISQDNPEFLARVLMYYGEQPEHCQYLTKTTSHRTNAQELAISLIKQP